MKKTRMFLGLSLISVCLSACSLLPNIGRNSSASSRNNRQSLNIIEVGVDPFYADGEGFVYYGFYPQTRLINEAYIEEIENNASLLDNGWYEYLGEYFMKTDVLSIASNGSDNRFYDGTSINIDGTYWFQCEPIKWKVLSIDDGEYYLLSESVLNAHCMYRDTALRTPDGDVIYANNYEHSDLREWLNNDFVYDAFFLCNDYLVESVVCNDESTTNGIVNTYLCNDTYDYVFLPSYVDYRNPDYGFEEAERGSGYSRRAYVTDFAKVMGAWFDSSGASYYWTRTPFEGHANINWSVNNYGYLNDADFVDHVDMGVRPAIKISF